MQILRTWEELDCSAISLDGGMDGILLPDAVQVVVEERGLFGGATAPEALYADNAPSVTAVYRISRQKSDMARLAVLNAETGSLQQASK